MVSGISLSLLSWRWQNCNYWPFFDSGIARNGLCCILSNYYHTLTQSTCYFICLVYNTCFWYLEHDTPPRRLTLMFEVLEPPMESPDIATYFHFVSMCSTVPWWVTDIFHIIYARNWSVPFGVPSAFFVSLSPPRFCCKKSVNTLFWSKATLIWFLSFYFLTSIVGLCLRWRWPHLTYCW